MDCDSEQKLTGAYARASGISVSDKASANMLNEVFYQSCKLYNNVEDRLQPWSGEAGSLSTFGETAPRHIGAVLKIDSGYKAELAFMAELDSRISPQVKMPAILHDSEEGF